jgi:hypothetical protein
LRENVKFGMTPNIRSPMTPPMFTSIHIEAGLPAWQWPIAQAWVFRVPGTVLGHIRVSGVSRLRYFPRPMRRCEPRGVRVTAQHSLSRALTHTGMIRRVLQSPPNRTPIEQASNIHLSLSCDNVHGVCPRLAATFQSLGRDTRSLPAHFTAQ